MATPIDKPVRGALPGLRGMQPGYMNVSETRSAPVVRVCAVGGANQTAEESARRLAALSACSVYVVVNITNFVVTIGGHRVFPEFAWALGGSPGKVGTACIAGPCKQ